jgi:hypothetical protein
VSFTDHLWGRAECLEATGDERADCRRAAAEELRDRRVREVFEVAQGERRALAEWEPEEGRAERVVRSDVRIGAHVLGPPTLALQKRALDRPTPEVVLRQVHDRSSQVRLEGVRVAEEPEPTYEADERLLD